MTQYFFKILCYYKGVIKIKNNGKPTEQRIAKAWAQVKNSWRIRISDSYSTGERPADELVLVPEFNILNEIKSTDKEYINLSLIHKHQLVSLTNFANLQDRNIGLLTIEFLSFSKIVVLDVFEYIKHMQENNTQTWRLEDIIKSRKYVAHFSTTAELDFNRLILKLKEVKNDSHSKE